MKYSKYLIINILYILVINEICILYCLLYPLQYIYIVYNYWSHPEIVKYKQ